MGSLVGFDKQARTRDIRRRKTTPAMLSFIGGGKSLCSSSDTLMLVTV